MKNDYDVAAVFEEIEKDLMSNMARNLANHKADEAVEGFEWSQWQAEKAKNLRKFVRDNKKIVGKHSISIDKGIESIMRGQFAEGAAIVEKELRRSLKPGTLIQSEGSSDFFRINERKVNAQIRAAKKDMEKATASAFRKTNDVYRQTIWKAEMFASTGTKTVAQCVDKATQDFYKNGIKSIQYKNGAVVDVTSYARMAIRTANKRVFLMGEGAKRKEWGRCLVYMSEYGQCSPMCLPWQGKVYIDDVYSDPTAEQLKAYQSQGYTLLSEAMAGGAFHPNCRHTLSTYFEELEEDENNKPKSKQTEQETEGATKAEQAVNYLNRQAKGWDRVAEYSQAQETVEEAETKAKKCRKKAAEVKKSVANSGESDIIKLTEEQRVLQSKIDDGSIALKINPAMQKKHMQNSKEKGRSYFTISEKL
jgi:hypothetical protein